MSLTFVANHVRRRRRNFSDQDKITIINNVMRKASTGMTVEQAVKSEDIRINMYYRWRNSMPKVRTVPVCTDPITVYSEFDTLKAFFDAAPSGSILVLKK